jgi:hypothetical protein
VPNCAPNLYSLAQLACSVCYRKSSLSFTSISHEMAQTMSSSYFICYYICICGTFCTLSLYSSALLSLLKAIAASRIDPYVVVISVSRSRTSTWIPFSFIYFQHTLSCLSPLFFDIKKILARLSSNMVICSSENTLALNLARVSSVWL